jgi:hypothetical protein
MAPNTKVNLACSSPLKGRYFKLAKRYDKNRYMNIATIEVCELQVWKLGDGAGLESIAVVPLAPAVPFTVITTTAA